MTFEDMMHMKRLGETAVSADGKWLGYSVTTVDLEKNTKTPEIWLQPIAGGEPLKVSATQPGDGGLQFAPDGKRVLFVSGREGASQVWIADFDDATGATSNAKKLTSISTEADNAKWSPDGRFIVFTSNVYPDCAPITFADSKTGDQCNADRDKAKAESKVKAQIFTHLMYRHWNHFTGDKRSHLFLIEVDTGKLRDLTPNDTHDVPTDYPTSPLGCGCAISPDAKEMAFVKKDVPEEATSTNSDIFTLDLTSPDAKPIKVSTALGGDMDPAYSPDGRYLAWRSQARAGYESDKFRLALYDRGAKTIKYLLPKFENWVDEFAWGLNSETIYFVSGSRGSAPVYELDLRTGRAALWVTLQQGSGEFSSIHPTPVRNSVVATRMTAGHPSEVFEIVNSPAIVDVLPTKKENAAQAGRLPVYPVPEAKELRQLTHLNDALLANLDLSEMEDFWFTASDGTKEQGFLIRPPNFDPSKKYPLKFLIHGGPQGAWGDAWSYRWNAELFAANGYVVVMINPGGSTGYGQAFVDSVNGDWGGKPFTDLMSGLDYAEQHYPFIDKTRECALGASYGGYMANWVLGHTTRFKCIVSHDGMFDPESAYGTTEELWFNEWEFKGKPWDYYGKPDSENPYRKWAPMMSAKTFKTPTLVVHSQLDFRLDVSEGYQLFTTLQRLGVPSKMLYFPDEGHWVLKPQNSQLWWKTVNDWVDQWTTKPN
ncbi:alpha/beta hydrolase family protein [Occallatibacter savannae]|uniref:dipeptidyl-peptidase 5 n=1 Tax=Occallatibacter savannae TaxID=1002691 RepID=UPI000D695476|nr:S9 family peptidase [Occallatibacter savannae]